MTKTKLAKIVSTDCLTTPESHYVLMLKGGQIGHRKYDCPEQRNFTANIICRVCGNAGHMARDCPDRQRGADWRNGPPTGGPDRAPAGRIGGGDAVDREYEVSHACLGQPSFTNLPQQLMQELSGGAPAANGQAPQRIEAGPGGYDNQDGYGEGDRGDVKPWQRGPTGAAAPWQRGGDDRGHRDDYGAPDTGSAPPWAAAGRGGDNYGYGQPNGGAAPWQQQAAPPPPGGYGGYSGYGNGNGYAASMGAPPGLPAGGLGAPPGLNALFQYNGGNGPAGNPPPPPPPGDAPPPPVSSTSY